MHHRQRGRARWNEAQGRVRAAEQQSGRAVAGPVDDRRPNDRESPHAFRHREFAEALALAVCRHRATLARIAIRSVPVDRRPCCGQRGDVDHERRWRSARDRIRQQARCIPVHGEEVGWPRALDRSGQMEHQLRALDCALDNRAIAEIAEHHALVRDALRTSRLGPAHQAPQTVRRYTRPQQRAREFRPDEAG